MNEQNQWVNEVVCVTICLSEHEQKRWIKSEPEGCTTAMLTWGQWQNGGWWLSLVDLLDMTHGHSTTRVLVVGVCQISTFVGHLGLCVFNISVDLHGLVSNCPLLCGPRAVHEHPDLCLAAVHQGGGSLLVAGRPVWADAPRLLQPPGHR